MKKTPVSLNMRKRHCDSRDQAGVKVHGSYPIQETTLDAGPKDIISVLQRYVQGIHLIGWELPAKKQPHGREHGPQANKEDASQVHVEGQHRVPLWVGGDR